MRLKVTATRIMRRSSMASKSPVNGLSIASRTTGGSASNGEAVSGIGSSAAEMTDEEYRRVISDFVRNWHVGRRLAEVRRALSQAFEDDELERLFGEVETWAPNHPKPGP